MNALAEQADERRLPLPFGIATTIGSLPHSDAGDAVAFSLAHTPRLPAAPSLPLSHPREAMLAQASDGLLGVTVFDDGTLGVDIPALDPDAPFGPAGDVHLRDSASFSTTARFIEEIGNRVGFAKFQVTGPVTLAVALQAHGVEASLAFAVAGHAVQQRALALLAWVSDAAPQVSPVVFVDEPALVALLEDGFPCDPDTALDLTSRVLAALETGSITGIHCCGRADWRLLLQAGPQVLSLPLEAGVEEAAGSLAGFLERGGWLAWGAVPTDGPLGTTVERQWRKLSSTWCHLVQEGCDPVRLRTQAMITPVCGLATHGIPQAEQVLAFTAELAQRLHDQAIGVRLSVGA